MGSSRAIIEEPHERLANDKVIVESFGKDWQYPTKDQRPFGKWWKIHILLHHVEERTNVAIFEGFLSWIEAIRHNVHNVRISLFRIE